MDGAGMTAWRNRLPSNVVGGMVIAGVIAIWLGNLLGLWWLAALIGFSFGMLMPNWPGVLWGSATGAAGWAVGLLWLAIHHAIGPTATALSITLTLGASTSPSIILTIAVGALLAGSCGWLGRSLRVFSAARNARRLARD